MSPADSPRTALITGVCGGIGAAAAVEFANNGWAVIGVDRRPPNDDLPLTRFVEVDMGRDDGVRTLEHELRDLTELDALVNNAAVQVNASLVDTTDDEWALVMNTNVRAAFQMIRAFHVALEVRRGGIVNIGSVHSIATSANVAAYAVSKGALAALTRSAALELAERRVRCNAVLPGAIMTSMLSDGLGRRPHPDGAAGNLYELIERTPLGFVATPEQLAPSILHLADGERSPYTTGQLMVVDGGALLRLGTE